MEMNSSHQEGSAAVAAEQKSPGNIWGIIVGVFSRPSEAFQGIKDKPRVLIPLILTFVLLAVAAVPMTQYQAQTQMELLSKSTTIPPQVLDQLKERASQESPIKGVIMAIVIVFIVDIVGTLITWFIGSFIMGGEARFKQMWSVTILGGLIIPVGGIVRMILTLIKGDAHISLGLAAMMPGKDFTSIFYSFWYYFDVFFIWSLIVTGIGYGIVLGISRGKGITTALIWYLIAAAALIGMTAFGLSLAGVPMTFF